MVGVLKRCLRQRNSRNFACLVCRTAGTTGGSVSTIRPCPARTVALARFCARPGRHVRRHAWMQLWVGEAPSLPHKTGPRKTHMDQTFRRYMHLRRALKHNFRYVSMQTVLDVRHTPPLSSIRSPIPDRCSARGCRRAFDALMEAWFATPGHVHASARVDHS